MIVDPDVAQYGVGKTNGYTQSGPSTTTFQSFTFNAFVDQRAGGNLVGAVLQGPLLGGTQTLTLNAEGADFNSISFTGVPVTAKNNLNGNFSDSTPGNAGTNYRLKIDTSGAGSPDYDVSFSLAGDLYPADIPLFTLDNGAWIGGTYYADTVHNATQLSWSFPTYNSSTDVILLKIEPAAGGAEIVDEQFKGAFTGGFTLSQGLLTAGTEYKVQLTFARLVDQDTTTVPGVQGVAFYATETTFSFVAVPEPSTYVLLLLGLGSVWISIRRRRSAA